MTFVILYLKALSGSNNNCILIVVSVWSGRLYDVIRSPADDGLASLFRPNSVLGNQTGCGLTGG